MAVMNISSIEEPVCEQFFNHFQYLGMILSWLLIPVGIAGLGGNGLVVWIRLQPAMASSINFLLITLALADIGISLFGTIAFLPLGILDYYKHVPAPFGDGLRTFSSYTTLFIYPIANTIQTFSVYTLLLVSSERYLAVVHPFLTERFCTVRNAVIGSCIALGFSSAFNTPLFLERELVWENGTAGLKDVAVEKLGKSYYQVYHKWLYLVVMFIIPFTLLLISNLKIICELKASERFHESLSQCEQHDSSTTIMLLLVTFCFMATNALPFILRIYEVTFWLKRWSLREQIEKAMPAVDQQLLTAYKDHVCSYRMDIVAFLLSLSTFLVMTNSTVNFPIYYKYSQHFRNGFHSLWKRRGKWAVLLNLYPWMTRRSESRTNSILMNREFPVSPIRTPLTSSPEHLV